MHIVLDLYGRYALSYNISVTETAILAIEAFRRAFKMEPDASIRIAEQHTVLLVLTTI